LEANVQYKKGGSQCSFFGRLHFTKRLEITICSKFPSHLFGMTCQFHTKHRIIPVLHLLDYMGPWDSETPNTNIRENGTLYPFKWDICIKQKNEITLQGTNISHLGKRNIISNSALGWDMLSRRVS